MRKLVILSFVIIAILISILLLFSFMDNSGIEKWLSRDEMKKLVEKRAELYFDSDIEISNLSIDFINEFLREHVTYLIQGTIEDMVYPYHLILAVNHDGQIFELPEEFNEMIYREDINIYSKSQALNFTKGYILIEKYTDTSRNTIYLNNISDIPWEEKPVYANDPSNYSNLVFPPTVIFNKNSSIFSIQIYSWHLMEGLIIKWEFEVAFNGEITKDEDVIASFVGDCTPPIYE